MLHAIGIYTEDTSNPERITLKKEKHCQKDYSVLFPVNALKNIDKLLFESNFYSMMLSNQFYSQVMAHNEYNYIYKSTSAQATITISSKKKLDTSEKLFLVKNIQHILIRPDSVKISIDTILGNPLAYIGRDILCDKDDSVLKNKIDETIIGMHEVIDKVIRRGEALEGLQQKALNLEEGSIKFESSAKNLNACC